MPDGTGASARTGSGARVRRLLVLGANGPTGRLVVRQALDRGLAVTASTRHPAAFPMQHERLQLVEGDATDAAVMSTAVDGCDAVISVIGSAYTRRKVEVYSRSARVLLEAMRVRAVERVVVVTSAEVAPESAHQGGFVLDRVVYPLLRYVIGRTVYDDMIRMEAIVRDSARGWTIVRPPGLTGAPGVGYASAETHVAGAYCARDDLAAFLLDQLDDTTFLRKVAAVASPGLQVNPLDTIRREVLKR